jgi:hypothetical protein
MGSRLCRLPIVTLLCCPAASARATACRTARWAALAETAETPIAQAPASGECCYSQAREEAASLEWPMLPRLPPNLEIAIRGAAGVICVQWRQAIRTGRVKIGQAAHGAEAGRAPHTNGKARPFTHAKRSIDRLPPERRQQTPWHRVLVPWRHCLACRRSAMPPE